MSKLKEKLKNLKIAFFISDVGYGHMVRQRSIIKKILIKYPKTKITIVNHNNIQILKQTFREQVDYVDFFNNIKIIKKKNGFLDLDKTKKVFQNWEKKSKKINRLHKALSGYNLFVSDFVPEAFLLAKKMNIRSIGICHFTWSWFVKKIIKKNNFYYKRILFFENLADKIFFPPLTPIKIFNDFSKNKIIKINFVIDKKYLGKPFKKNKKKIFLIMDNGTKTLSSLISKSLKYLSKSKKFIFYIGTSTLKKNDIKYISKQKNLIPISDLNSIYEQIQKADYVIARGGFNTLTECLMFKKPSILSNEKNNPEVDENLKYFSELGFCSKLKNNHWGKGLLKRLDFFVTHESLNIKKNLNKKFFFFNGSDQILKYIEQLIR